MASKSKVSSGYLTPQPRRQKKTNGRSSNAKAKDDTNMPTMSEFDEDAFKKLLTCPIKRKLVLDLITSEKHNIEKFKQTLAKTHTPQQTASPLKNIQTSQLCNSPTMLFRKRALEQLNSKNSSSSCGDSIKSTSRQSYFQSPIHPSPIQFDKLLEGVIAYVEFRGEEQSRSNAVQMLMQSMGAIVRETFTRDVTHVVFKDGSITTFQKAKLLKVPMVSVLWIEAVRTTGMRVSERKFPALGTSAYDNNISAVCSQMQKEYEEIIREELHRSLTTGTPMPSKKALIDRRRTMAGCSQLSQEFASSQDKEVANILSRRKTILIKSVPRLSPELNSDSDSDLGAIIDGDIIPKLKKQDLNLPDEIKENDQNMSNDIYNQNTPKLKSKYLEDTVFVTPDSSLYNRRTLLFNSLDSSQSKNTSKDLKILSKNECIVNPADGQNTGDYTSSMSDLKISTGSTKNGEKSTSTNMSSLRMSNESNNMLDSLSKGTKSAIEGGDNVETSVGTNMSSLRMSSSIKSGSLLKSASKLSEKPSDIADNITRRTKITVKETDIVETSSSINMSSLAMSISASNQLEKAIVNNVTKRTKRNVKDSESCQKHSTDMSFLKVLSESNDNRKSVLRNASNTSEETDNITKRKKSSVKKKKIVSSDIKETSNYIKDASDSPVNRSKRNRRRTILASQSSVGTDEQQLPCINEKSIKDTNAKEDNITKTKSPDKSSSDAQSTSDDNNFKTPRRMRKLYDPNNPLNISVNDEKEREILRRAKKRKSSSDDEVFLIPKSTNLVTPVSLQSNLMLTRKASQYLEKNQITLQDILNRDTDESDTEAVKSKRRTKRKNKNTVPYDIDDEQKELKEEMLKKKSDNEKTIEKKLRNANTSSSDNGSCKKKKSVKSDKRSKKISIRLTQGKLNLSSSSSDGPVKPMLNRRSTLEFQSLSQMKVRRKLRIDEQKSPSIVCTKLHRDEIMVFNQIVKKLGGFVIEDEVTEKTTHLVAGEPKRTINMLRAITMGCWILKHEWLLKSLEAGKWLPEEDYEETDFSPAVQKSRLQRQAFGPSYTMDILRDCGQIYVARGSIPRCSDLRELIRQCKGKVTTIMRNAAIIVGGYHEQGSTTCVQEAWLLDSITNNRRMPFKKYVISTDNKVYL